MKRRYRDLTIRQEPCDRHIARDVALHLWKKQVVVWMPNTKRWKRGKLTDVIPNDDWFRVTWYNGGASRLVGLWRVHDAKLFRGRRLPVPKNHAKLQQVKPKPKRRANSMATRSTTKKSAAKPKSRAKSNGSVNLREMSQKEKRSLASEIKAMRRDKTPWSEIKEELGLGSALQGRALLREFGGEGLIREQEGGGSTKKTASKGSSRRKRQEVDDDEEDDEDEDEAPVRRRRATKPKVGVKRGRGKAANPS